METSGIGDMVGEISYRVLRHSEWPYVRDIFIEHGGRESIPDPKHSEIVIAECDGKLVGLLVRQLVSHAEPLWIEPAFRGKVNWRKMLRIATANVPSYFVFAPTDHIRGLCEAAKLSELPWKVFNGINECHS